VENGADAIYFGLDRFNARMRANNFTEADLPRLMEFLHLRGVKGYLTFNTLVFENEMADAEQYLKTLIRAGVDAAIVQDVGICRLIRRFSPDFPLHISTQMTITSAEGIEFARRLGANLVVLARECSLKEIEQMVSLGSGITMPLEVFVHGALCVAYSGQCLTSEALGGRSANRGECAQACRMPYDLIADGQPLPLGNRKYLLSPQDLAGLELLPELARLGVASLKIEGRLKSAEYVANITQNYRQALDALAAGSPAIVPESAQYEMEMAFSRGLYTGWFRGINNQKLVHAHFGKKRGVYLGLVAEVRGETVTLQLEGPLKRGDGIVFDAGKPEEKEEGGRVYDIQPQGHNRVRLAFGRGDIDFRRVHAGDKLWKTGDPELERRLRQSFEGEAPKYQRPLSFEVHGCLDKPLTLIARDEEGHIARADSTMPLVAAQTQPLTTQRLQDQLGRMGGTPFNLGKLANHLEGSLMLPLSELNRLRRDVIQELQHQRQQPRRWKLFECGMRSAECGMGDNADSKVRSAELKASITDTSGESPRLNVLVRNLDQLQAVLGAGAETIYCDFEDPKKYRDAVTLFRTHHSSTPSVPDTPPRDLQPAAHSALRTPHSALPPHSALYVAPPRIFKMGEDWVLKQVRSSGADGYLIRNYDHLKFFAGERCVGDYSLNIANRLTAEYYKTQPGLERVTASYDLNFSQLEALLRAAPPEWFEITLHQHMPMFHMEHCLFCAFLSKGTDYTNCGRPCDKHDLKLRDRVGAEHPVKADAGCRNTVFNSLAQTGAEYLPQMLALGARRFRLEFLNESPEQVRRTIARYQQLLRGEITGTDLWRELKLFNQLGVTRGQIGTAERTGSR
jgi:putative protease